MDAEAYVTANEVDARTAIKLIWSAPDAAGNTVAGGALTWRIEVTIDDNEWKRLYPRYGRLSGLGEHRNWLSTST